MTKKAQNEKFYPGALSSFHIEIDKTPMAYSLSCKGVKGISEFSDEEIKLLISDFSILVKGDKLCMAVFENKCVEITGKISEVKFVYGKS